MSLPRILLIDDQIARSDAQKIKYLKRMNAVEHGKTTSSTSAAIVTFCGGQTQATNIVTNSKEVIFNAVGQGAEEWALVLLDVQFDSGHLSPEGLVECSVGDDHFGEEVRDQLKQNIPDLPIVMLTSKHESELKNKGHPFLSKTGLDEAELKKCLLQHGRLTTEQRRNLLELDDVIVASSEKMIGPQGAITTAFIFAPSKQPIVVRGESGAGKEGITRYIHRMSGRKGAFVAVNSAAIPENLVEAELFGHTDKAFTGAKSAKAGKFEEANNGTLFLDEIGDLPYDVQTKILRVLQEGTFTRMGSNVEQTVDVRLVCATWKNLEKLVQENKFRQDLLSRITGQTIYLPPLRERKEDIRPLATAFLEKAMKAIGKIDIIFSDATFKLLQRQDFKKGNIRDLETLVTNLVISSGNRQELSVEDIEKALNNGTEETECQAEAQPPIPPATACVAAPSLPSELSIEQFIELAAQVSFAMDDESLQGILPRLDEATRNLKRRMAGALLKRHPGQNGVPNLQRAMQELTGEDDLGGVQPRRRFVTGVIGGKQTDYSNVVDLMPELLRCIAEWSGEEQQEMADDEERV